MMTEFRSDRVFSYSREAFVRLPQGEEVKADRTQDPFGPRVYHFQVDGDRYLLQSNGQEWELMMDTIREHIPLFSVAVDLQSVRLDDFDGDGDTDIWLIGAAQIVRLYNTEEIKESAVIVESDVVKDCLGFSMIGHGFSCVNDPYWVIPHYKRRLAYPQPPRQIDTDAPLHRLTRADGMEDRRAAAEVFRAILLDESVPVFLRLNVLERLQFERLPLPPEELELACRSMLNAPGLLRTHQARIEKAMRPRR